MHSQSSSGARLILVLAGAAALATAACGGSHGTGQGSNGAPQLTSITISAPASTVVQGLTLEMAATAHYSDASSEDVTARAEWSSSDDAVIAFDARGLARGVAPGTAKARATLNGVVGEMQLSVSPPAPRLEVARSSAFHGGPRSDLLLAVGDVVPFEVTMVDAYDGHHPVTGQVTYLSSDPGIMSPLQPGGASGWFGAVAAGSAAIQATVDGQTAASIVTVAPFPALDTWVGSELASVTSGAGMDADGRAHVAWAYQASGSLWGTAPVIHTASYAPGSGWSPSASIDFGDVTDPPQTVALAVAPNGNALLAWAGHRGIYGAAYTPPAGWQRARVLTSGSSPFGSFSSVEVRVAVDALGNGIAVWTNDNGDKVLAARYDLATDAWSAPQQIPGGDRGAANSPLALAMDASGAAVVVWESWGSDWTVQASRFVPGTGAGAGWQAPEPLAHSASYTTPAVAMAATGDIVALWVEYIAEFPRSAIYARRFVPAEGWHDPARISPSAVYSPADPEIAMNDGGDAVVVFTESSHSDVLAIRSDGASAWHAPEALWTARVAAGTPVAMRPQLTAAGRILATFHLEELGAPGPVAVARYAPGSGWQPTGVLSNRIGHFGKLEGFRVASNALGDAVALWGETFDVWDDAWWTFDSYYADASFTF